MSISPATMYGLIGKPLSHSFSKQYFTDKFNRENILNASYNLYELQNITELPDLINNNPELKGLNVTVPYKVDVMPVLSYVDMVSQQIGAVNTIKIIRENNKTILQGFNTDVIGFQNSLSPLLSSHHNKALVIGSGGASKAVCYVLQQLGISYFVVSRRSNEFNNIDYKSVNKSIIEDCFLIINCTPVGMYPHIDKQPDIPYQYLTKKHLLFDLVYNPKESLFLKAGASLGAKTKSGLEMLYLQAEASWKIWNNV